MLNAFRAVTLDGAPPIEMIIVLRDQATIEPKAVTTIVQTELPGWAIETIETLASN